ncbi:MAG: YlbL family protein [Actinomycetes bacterium]
MSRRTATLVVSGVLVVLLSAAAAVLPVPYVVLQPGPTTNTLGTSDGKPLIRIEGRRTYPASGHLDLTTVAVFGGPGDSVDLFTALRGWLDETVAVVPEETVFPPGKSAHEVEKETEAQMSESQEYATAAAFDELGVAVGHHVEVGSVLADSPADGQLRAGDEVVAVDGTPIRTPEAVREGVGNREPGDDVRLTIRRDGDRRTLTLATEPSPEDEERPVVGFVPREGHDFPFEVTIDLEKVGGPSAGLMFAVGIVEKLTPGNLTNGQYVAGTGTIDDDGRVGPIGGIQQKVAAAEDVGAHVFLTPAGNCADAAAVNHDGVRLVRVETLGDALDALDALKTGRGNVPTCAE